MQKEEEKKDKKILPSFHVLPNSAVCLTRKAPIYHSGKVRSSGFCKSPVKFWSLFSRPVFFARKPPCDDGNWYKNVSNNITNNDKKNTIHRIGLSKRKVRSPNKHGNIDIKEREKKMLIITWEKYKSIHFFFFFSIKEKAEGWSLSAWYFPSLVHSVLCKHFVFSFIFWFVCFPHCQLFVHCKSK